MEKIIKKEIKVTQRGLEYTDLSTWQSKERVFEIPQVPFAFEFESGWPNDNSVTKQSPNYHSSDLDKVGQMSEWHSAV